MTEGNISSWKVKEGDSFSAGDILLEIETDKASMDVEAQEDGVMAKIFQGDGSKSVKVGTRIAVVGDAGDDVSSLEIPADDSKPVESEAENIKGGEDSKYESSGAEKSTPGTPQDPRPAKDKAKTSPQGPGANPKYPLYPSVIALIHENHISDADVAKIAATGPNGRLLKGDVLAYLGTIEPDYSAEQSKRIEHMGHLDLSNIKVLPATPANKPAPSEDTTRGKAAAEVTPVTSISLPISLSEVLKVQKRVKDTLGVTIPISTFLARAVDLANDDLPNPKNAKPSADDLFNAVLGLNSIPTTSRGTYLPQIDAFPVLPQSTRQPASSSRSPRLGTTAAKKIDILDILSGKVTPRRAAAPLSTASTPGRTLTTSDGAVNVFSLTVPKGEEKRARTFLERVKTVLQVEPGKLVL
jgi:pyruvate/2-oxoglutarate dehydrogenase complex dihydrolipoamide acyltransferase (E2) component